MMEESLGLPFSERLQKETQVAALTRLSRKSYTCSFSDFYNRCYRGGNRGINWGKLPLALAPVMNSVLIKV